MGWLENLLFNSDSIAHIVLLYSVVISLGVLLGRIRIFVLLKLQARRSIDELSCSRRHPAEHRSDDHSMAMSFRQGRPAHDGRCPVGAVTNTPGLGAANEALSQMGYSGPQIANGYACAYPLGVVGIICATILIKHLCKVNLSKEKEMLSEEQSTDRHEKPHRMYVELTNEALEGSR